jgi:hypothetical protein
VGAAGSSPSLRGAACELQLPPATLQTIVPIADEIVPATLGIAVARAPASAMRPTMLASHSTVV